MKGMRRALLGAVVVLALMFLTIATACNRDIIPSSTPSPAPENTEQPVNSAKVLTSTPPPIRNPAPTPRDTATPKKTCELNVLIEPVDAGYVEIQGSETVNSGDTTSVTCNDQMNLIARPSDDTKWKFVRWQGDVGGPQTAQVILMDNSKVVRAVFECLSHPCGTVTTAETPAFQLTINNLRVSGTSVAVPNGRIDLSDGPTRADDRYPKGAKVILSPKPAEGFAFSEWSGACNESGSCVVTMDSNKSVIAVFEKNSYSLIMNGTQVTGASVTLSNGTVTVSPAPNASVERFRHGTPVTFSLMPAPGYKGACTPESVNMTSDKTVTCIAAKGSHPLIMNGNQVTGASVTLNNGTVDVSPAPNASGGQFLHGTPVTLSLRPAPRRRERFEHPGFPDRGPKWPLCGHVQLPSRVVRPHSLPHPETRRFAV